MKLSEAQLNHFKTFGYIGLPQLFNHREITTITEEFDAAIMRHMGGDKHDGSQRTMFGGPIERSEKLLAILDDPRMDGVLTSILGDEFNYCGGDGNYYSGDTAWHPDGSWGRLFAVKVAFYLDPLTKDTGCLRVIPGSHDPQHFIRRNMQGWASNADPNKSQELYGVLPREYPGNVPLETNPGDVVIFNHDTWHSAWGGGKRRKMFTMNCTIHAKTPEDKEQFKQYISVHSAGGYKVDTGAGMYFPLTLDTAGERRMTHLRQAAEMHDVLFPQYARNRAAATATA